MHVVLVNRFYWPETPATGQLLADLAPALAAAGHEVEVITGIDAAGELDRRQRHDGVLIHRVGNPRATEAGLGGKARAFAGFAVAATARMMRRTRRGSLLVCLTDPPLLGIAAAAVASLRGARLVHWIQDIYPEIAERLVPAPALAALRPLRNAAWRRADGCVTLGEDMAATVARGGVAPRRIRVIPNWAPAGLGPCRAEEAELQRRQWGLAGTFLVAYSGNLGRVHDLETLLGAAQELRHDPGFTFAFIGAGPAAEHLRSEAIAAGLTHVHFLPPQPRGALAATLGAADVHLASLRPEAHGLVFPSKVLGIAAAARPLVLVAPPDCDVAHVVRSADAGLVVANGDSRLLAAALRQLRADPALRQRLGANGGRLAAQHGFATAREAWLQLLADLETC